MPQFTIQTNGQSLVVASSSATLYSDAAYATPVTLPQTIATATTYYTTDTAPLVTVTQVDGTTLYSAPVPSVPSGQIAPAPAPDQITSDLSRIPTRAFQSMASPVVGVTAALKHNRSATMATLGDSTGDTTAEWFSLLGQRIGGATDCNVLWRAWNDTNQNYDMPTTLLTGASGARYATLASGALTFAGATITGDIEVIVKASLADWTPAATNTLVSRYETTGNQRGWQLSISTSGRIQWIWSSSGTAATATINSTVSVPFTDGAVGWVRVTFDVDNGASGNTAKFYTSDDGSTWSQLGSDVVTASTTSLFASTAPVQIGSVGTAITTPMAGSVYWVEVRDALANGSTTVPPLPDDWDQITSSTSGTVTFGGSPTLLLLSGSQSGQNIAYLDNATRRPKINAPHGQDVVFLSTGHNEGNLSGAGWITTLSAWVTNLKSTLPGVPLVLTTQNPTAIGSTITNQNMRTVRAFRTAATATWAASQAGVYCVDTYRAITDTATQINADGLHPESTGSQAWADYMFTSLFASLA